MIDGAHVRRWLDGYRQAWLSYDPAAIGDLFTEDAEYHEDPFEPPLVGSNALRAYLLEAAEAQDQVEVTMERHWVVGDTALAVWHASFVRVPDRTRVRLAGFMTLETAGDGRVRRFREWWHRRETAATG